jgi:hypothetical protein
MTDAAPRRWTVEEFFAWQERQPRALRTRGRLSPANDGRRQERTRRHRRQRAGGTAQSAPGRRAAGRSQATEVLRQNPAKSAGPTSASTAGAGTPTQPRQHLLASSSKFSLQPRGTSTQSANLTNTSSLTAWQDQIGARSRKARQYDSHKTYYGIFPMFPYGNIWLHRDCAHLCPT